MVEDSDSIERKLRELHAARLIEKKGARRYTAEDAPPSLAAATDKAEWWPTKVQYARFNMYLKPRLGVTAEGSWHACCPMHDPKAKGEASALIQFSEGHFICLSVCHDGKKAMTLSNVLARMPKTGEEVAIDDSPQTD